VLRRVPPRDALHRYPELHVVGYAAWQGSTHLQLDVVWLPPSPTDQSGAGAAQAPGPPGAATGDIPAALSAFVADLQNPERLASLLFATSGAGRSAAEQQDQPNVLGGGMIRVEVRAGGRDTQRTSRMR
jgi:hypothetical protein